MRPRFEQLADLSWHEHIMGGQWAISVLAMEAAVNTKMAKVVHMAKGLFHLSLENII